MPPDLDDLVRRPETENYDRKSSLDLSFPQDYLKLAADLVAMANTDGGSILVGTRGVKFSKTQATLFDSARIDDKVNSLVEPRIGLIKSSQIDEDFMLVEIEKSSNPPHVFKQDGNCTDRQGKSALVFRKGDIFVRHSSKSERLVRTDVDRWFEMRQRKLLDNVKLIFEANPDAKIQIAEGSTGMPVRISPEDPEAQPVYDLLTADPYRSLGQELTGSIKAWKTSLQILNETQIFKSYAERQDIQDIETIELLARSCWERFMPGYYWASKLSAEKLVRILRATLESGTHPASVEALKIASLLPREHSKPLFQLVGATYKKSVKNAIRKFEPVLRARARKYEALVEAVAPTQKLIYADGEGIKEVKKDAVTEVTFNEILKTLVAGHRDNRGVFKLAELLVFGRSITMIDFSSLAVPDDAPNAEAQQAEETSDLPTPERQILYDE